MTKWNSLVRRTALAATLGAAVPLHAAPPAQPSPAAPCLTEAELQAMLAYAMPSAIEGVAAHCTPHLAGDSFLRRSGGQLVARYATNRSTAWPGAKTAFLKLAGEKDPQSVGMVAKMPDAALQPFVEALIGGLVGSRLKPGQCVLADQMLRLLAPLPPENTVELLGTIIALAGSETRKGSAPALAVCQA